MDPEVTPSELAVFLEAVSHTAIEMDPLDPAAIDLGMRILAELKLSPRFADFRGNIWRGVDPSVSN